MSGQHRTSTEIAHCFSGTRDDATLRIARRLENWGNIGLLTPDGERHTGRGRARAYDEYEQVKASVLLLCFTYQMPKAVLGVVSRLFDDIRRFKDGKHPKKVRPRSEQSTKKFKTMAKWLDDARSGEQELYLILYPEEIEDAPKAILSTNLEILKNKDSAAVVNVTHAAKRVP